jgi:hypothetical protein
MDKHAEADSRFSQLCERAEKKKKHFISGAELK